MNLTYKTKEDIFREDDFLLHFKKLENTGLVKHCFTTRLGGVSHGIYESMNMGPLLDDDIENVRENYKRVTAKIGVPYESVVLSRQTHTTNVRRITLTDVGNGVLRENAFTDVDGLITNETGVTLVTHFADCVPLYFVDTKNKAIGLSHSGWRGTVNKMGKVTVEKMKEEFGTYPKDLVCAIGPSICMDCYEVSEDVALEFEKAFPEEIENILYNKGNGKYQLNLWKANYHVLREAGVRGENIAVTDLCTCCNPKLLFSHRASHGKRGLMGAFLALK
ncbi:MAG: peptidoglycan editing factor PgeF [Lachnospiraceae bacterium]|nr:peptidoglycan editing factor PgeF [Lachnospiraceae bacterium]